MAFRYKGAPTIGEILGLILGSGVNSVEKNTSKLQTFKAIRKQFSKSYSRSHFSHQLHDLKRSGYVTFEPGSDSVIFTRKAELRIIEQRLKFLHRDGQFRFVSFDIPEQHHLARDGFRCVIKRLGFKQIQKSLWATNKDVADYVELAEKEYGVEKYVAYIVAESTDVDEEIIDKLREN